MRKIALKWWNLLACAVYKSSGFQWTCESARHSRGKSMIDESDSIFSCFIVSFSCKTLCGNLYNFYEWKYFRMFTHTWVGFNLLMRVVGQTGRRFEIGWKFCFFMFDVIPNVIQQQRATLSLFKGVTSIATGFIKRTLYQYNCLSNTHLKIELPPKSWLLEIKILSNIEIMKRKLGICQDFINNL